MSEAWIIDACRTPRGVGKYGKGSLSALHPQHIGSALMLNAPVPGGHRASQSALVNSQQREGRTLPPGSLLSISPL